MSESTPLDPLTTIRDENERLRVQMDADKEQYDTEFTRNLYLSRLNDTLCAITVHLKQEQETLLSELRRLHEALETYGDHLNTCPAFDTAHIQGAHPCTCGYAAALSGGSETQP